MSRWSTLFLGAVIAVGTAAMLLSLGMGLGLSFLPLESIEGTASQVFGLGLASVAYLVAVLCFSSFLGAGIASGTATIAFASKKAAAIHGAGVWGLILSVELVVGSVVLAPLAISAAGLSGAGVGAAAFWEEFRKSNPRVVSDMSIFKGKVVSTLQLGKNATLPDLIASAEKNAAKAVDAEAVEGARKASAGLALLVFLVSLGTLVSSIAGGIWGAKPASFSNVRQLSRHPQKSMA